MDRTALHCDVTTLINRAHINEQDPYVFKSVPYIFIFNMNILVVNKKTSDFVFLGFVSFFFFLVGLPACERVTSLLLWRAPRDELPGVSSSSL